MPLESQLTSLPLSRRLKELNVPQQSQFYWLDGAVYGWRPGSIQSARDVRQWKGAKVNFDGEGIFVPAMSFIYSAFSVAELGLLLPWYMEYGKSNTEGPCFARYILKNEDKYEEADTEANARALMLIHLRENNLIKTGAGR